jgi:hypothetical protein
MGRCTIGVMTFWHIKDDILILLLSNRLEQSSVLLTINSWLQTAQRLTFSKPVAQKSDIMSFCLKNLNDVEVKE